MTTSQDAVMLTGLIEKGRNDSFHCGLSVWVEDETV